MSLAIRVLACLAFVLAPAAAPAAKKPVAYDAVKPDDPGAALAADFAVKERSAKEKKEVKLGAIVKAERHDTKLDAGTFRLCLKVTTNGAESVVQAMVSVDQYSNHKLVS